MKIFFKIFNIARQCDNDEGYKNRDRKDPDRLFDFIDEFRKEMIAGHAQDERNHQDSQEGAEYCPGIRINRF